MNQNTRIQLEDTTVGAIVKVAEGNPGAVTVLARLIREGGNIDPDDFMGGVGSVLALDSHAIYGSDIWVLYKDVCNENLTTMCGVLRSIQLGFTPESIVKSWIAEAQSSRFTKTADVAQAVQQVRVRLPRFGQV